MTDNEIVKALECFSSNEYGCKGCPFIERGCFDCGHIPIEISSSILELINRQKAEIEMDDVEIKELRIALQGYLDDLTKERNLYKKSIEELNQAKAENEKLKTNLNIELENYATEYDNKIKAEAYREFAERFKILLEKELHWCECVDEIIKPLDNLLKEFVGDDDG